ncbi:hypothetical protein [Lichenifustis flavocetrariae]|uniref:Uncharacterized protein n=1 Tax=Lichenifustis flavocetrariae TaxID=2949735 RepID=A0AA42CM15_9HYPH|nr:hypothetical protein [Lichenifustis flavocetrariae]MCW6507895.1 hypothetical protein [Lichenifustis flavocetrariae]
MDYTFSIGTDDPLGLTAESDAAAIGQTVAWVREKHIDELGARPETVVTLMGPAGLVTRPSERLDEFVERVTGTNPAANPEVLQPGDLNTPDCNGD